MIRKNGDMCARCGVQPRAVRNEVQLSYCAECSLFHTKQNQERSIAQQGRRAICSMCHEEKEIYGPMVIYCIECSRKLFTKNEIVYRKKKFEWLASLKDGRPCTDCGVVYPPYVMEWDHCKGEKLFNIGASIRRGYEEIRAEIAKCELVCSNCHKERTHQRNVVRKAAGLAEIKED